MLLTGSENMIMEIVLSTSIFVFVNWSYPPDDFLIFGDFAAMFLLTLDKSGIRLRKDQYYKSF